MQAEELIGWAFALGITYGAYKLVFGPSLLSFPSLLPPPPANPPPSFARAGSSTARRAIPDEAIAQVTAVLPHVSGRAARWELERNGGSVERAVERGLREGGLPEVRPLSTASSLCARWGGTD